MTREEDLKEEGRIAVDEYVREFGDYTFGEDSMVKMFVLGANYADQNPRKGLWDSKKICQIIHEVINSDTIGQYLIFDDENIDFDSELFFDDLRKAMGD